MFRPVTPFVAGTAGAIYRAGLEAIRSGQTVIDLGDVEAADSSAVAVLVGWRRAAQQRGVTLAFINLPATLLSLVSLYGVNGLLQGGAQPHH